MNTATRLARSFAFTILFFYGIYIVLRWENVLYVVVACALFGIAWEKI